MCTSRLAHLRSPPPPAAADSPLKTWWQRREVVLVLALLLELLHLQIDVEQEIARSPLLVQELTNQPRRRIFFQPRRSRKSNFARRKSNFSPFARKCCFPPPFTLDLFRLTLGNASSARRITVSSSCAAFQEGGGRSEKAIVGVVRTPGCPNR
ncbi:hypothetical protein NL676_038687 [Syzygium grande]|nr:hypothetical protein NL676_038687 [Syzygium grande]